MKRAVCVAIFFLMLGPAAFIAAGLLADSQCEGIVITESTIYGDPETASGLSFRVTAQWQDYLVWDTTYCVGSGDTESEFSFYPYKKDWQEPISANFELWMPLQWGMVRTNGPSLSFDPEGSYLPEVVRAVMERTAPGESHTETVRLRDYYEYYPLRFSLDRNDLNVRYNDDERKFYADFFHVPVPEWMTLQITLEKNDAGDVAALDCGSECYVEFSQVFVFGQDGCFFVYYPDDGTGSGVAQTGADPGIYYVPYLMGTYSNSIDPEQTHMLYELPPGLIPVDMELNEARGELYLATKEGQDYYLNVYQTDQKSSVQKQKLFVRSVSGETGEEGNPFWVRMSVRDEGVLMTWRDGSFAFAASGEEGMELWCLSQHPGSAVNFPSEHDWAFDGDRLALISLTDWTGLDVELAVFQSGELSWYGICSHSGDIGSDQVSFSLGIHPPGALDIAVPVDPEYRLYYRRGSVATQELLGVEWE